MPQVIQLGFLSRTLAEQPCLRIGGRLMRLIRALLSVEIHGGIARILGGGVVCPASFFLKLFRLAQASISVPSTVNAHPQQIVLAGQLQAS